MRPIFLLADSRLLFAAVGAGPFVHRIAAEIDDAAWVEGPRAAYLGASNGDQPEYYELFRDAVGGAGITRCHHVRATHEGEPTLESLAFLDAADVILLAGGDMDAGWTALADVGLTDRVRERVVAGAVLVGVSAGAILLGRRNADEGALGLVPAHIDAHAEPSWERLEARVLAAGVHATGIGIPFGAGLVFHPNGDFEPVAKACTEIVSTSHGPRRSELFPPSSHRS